MGRPTSNMHDYQHNTTMSVQFSSSLSQRPIFIFLLQMLCQITWVLTGWKHFLYFRRPPWGLRPVAFATSATWLIRHWVLTVSASIDSGSWVALSCVLPCNRARVWLNCRSQNVTCLTQAHRFHQPLNPGPDLSVWRPWPGSLLEAPTHPQML